MRERPGASLGRVRFPLGDPRPVPILAHRVSCGPLILGYLVKVPHLRNRRVRIPRHRATGVFQDPLLPASFSTGRGIGLSPVTREVTGSSPVSGSGLRPPSGGG